MVRLNFGCIFSYLMTTLTIQVEEIKGNIFYAKLLELFSNKPPDMDP